MYTYTTTYFEMTNSLNPQYVDLPEQERVAKAQSELDKAVSADIVEFDLDTAIFIISQYYRVDRDTLTTDRK